MEPQTTKVMEGGMMTPIAPCRGLAERRGEGCAAARLHEGRMTMMPRAATGPGWSRRSPRKKQANKDTDHCNAAGEVSDACFQQDDELSEIPEASMMLPPRMKKGMACRTALLVAGRDQCGTVPRMMFTGRPASMTSIAATS